MFESGKVRPLALSPNEHELFAVNTDNRLEIDVVTPTRPRARGLGAGRARAGRRRDRRAGDDRRHQPRADRRPADHARTNNGATVGPRIDLLEARADAGDRELIAKAELAGFELGFFDTGGSFTSGLAASPNLTATHLRQFGQSSGQPRTYTCVPPGSGFRLGVDRDGDGHRDGDERQAGSDPADPNDAP